MNETLTSTSSPDLNLPLARVQGESWNIMPKDLYIPPDAMQVFLEAFEGPLDLLLYLIKKQNLDILNIPIARVTQQYMEYVEVMKNNSLELAGEYLVMAALLAEIKSRMLLPRVSDLSNEEEDPRAELVRRLQEYERFKQAASTLDELPRLGRDIFWVDVFLKEDTRIRPQPKVALPELILALKEVLKRSALNAKHQIHLEPLSIRERMTRIMSSLQEKDFATFSSFFDPIEGRLGVVVTFLAMLELLKERLIDFVQTTPFGPIHLSVVPTG